MIEDKNSYVQWMQKQRDMYDRKNNTADDDFWYKLKHDSIVNQAADLLEDKEDDGNPWQAVSQELTYEDGTVTKKQTLVKTFTSQSNPCSTCPKTFIGFELYGKVIQPCFYCDRRSHL